MLKGVAGTDIAGAASVSLRQFRLYEEADVTWDPGLNVLSGENAQGKTSLLEALFLASTGRLLRGGRDRDAIREGCTWAAISVRTIGSDSELSVRIQEGSRKTASLNGATLPRTSDLLGRMPCVSVTSLDVELARGEPAERRMYLDLQLSQLYSSYLRDLSLYKRALEHRNALLRRATETHVAVGEFEPWEAQMAVAGSALRSARWLFVADMKEIAAEAHGSVGDGEELGISYSPKGSEESPDELRAALESGRTEDLRRGSTSVGPHRDDLAILVGGRDARLFASQGQQRTAAISLKLATLDFCAQRGQKPLLLLDDMLSDLDAGRRARLVEWVIVHCGQAILTCTEESAAGERLLGRAKLFRVAQGKVRAA